MGRTATYTPEEAKARLNEYKTNYYKNRYNTDPTFRAKAIANKEKYYGLQEAIAQTATICNNKKSVTEPNDLKTFEQIYSKLYYTNNKESIKAKSRQYYETHKEAIKAKRIAKLAAEADANNPANYEH